MSDDADDARGPASAPDNAHDNTHDDAAQERRWRETTYRRAVERAGEREARFTTSSQIEVEPLYTDANLADWSPDEALGFPGEYPYTRGAQPTMYRGRLWTMRQ